jgi:hypothetical protein
MQAIELLYSTLKHKKMLSGMPYGEVSKDEEL